MAHTFKIKFWETFNTPGYYDILIDGQYKMPNSNDGCMWLQAPTTCPEWNKGTDEDVKSSNGSAYMLASPLSVSQR